MCDSSFMAQNTVFAMLCLAPENLVCKVRPEDLKGLTAGTSLSLLNILCTLFLPYCLMLISSISAYGLAFMTCSFYNLVVRL